MTSICIYRNTVCLKHDAFTFPALFWSDPMWPSSLRMTEGQYTSQPGFQSHDPPWPISLRPFLNKAQSCLARYLRQLRQDFAKSPPSGTSDRLVSLQPHGPVIGHCFRRDTTDIWEWKKRWHHWLRMGLKFLLNLCMDQQTLWDPSDPSYKNKNERRDASLQIAKAFGQCNWMDPILFIWRTKVTEDYFAKWAFPEQAKLY